MTTIVIENYIVSLKARIHNIQANIPEFWAHEKLREIQTLYGVIYDLKALCNITEEDPEMVEIKSWLKSYSR